PFFRFSAYSIVSLSCANLLNCGCSVLSQLALVVHLAFTSPINSLTSMFFNSSCCFFILLILSSASAYSSGKRVLQEVIVLGFNPISFAANFLLYFSDISQVSSST